MKMAASLRAGVAALLRCCQSWPKGTMSSATPALGVCSQTAGSSLLSRFLARGFASLSPTCHSWNSSVQSVISQSKWAMAPTAVRTPQLEQVRTKVRYSRNKGKPQTVHAVVNRFYRLNWGIWIRTRAGRAKKLWKKSSERKYRLRQHVFCNRTQSKLLDRMVTRYWRRPRYWVDDPYQPYHKRQNFDAYFPQKSRPFYP